MKKCFPLFLFILLSFISTIERPSNVFAQDGTISAITFDEDSFTLDDWDSYEDEPEVKDPLERYNRWMFGVNDTIYRRVFTPIAKGYDFLIPRKVQGSINNFARLTSTPKRIFNNLLQKKFKFAFVEFERLLINSTIGIGGLFDPASAVFKLQQHTEDFGQTLGVYGMNAGSYIIWPILGPSTTRNTIGFAGDFALNPFFWTGIYDVDPQNVFRGIGYTKRVNNYSYTVKDSYARITESAIDPYIALRHAYSQNRTKRVQE